MLLIAIGHVEILFKKSQTVQLRDHNIFRNKVFREQTSHLLVQPFRLTFHKYRLSHKECQTQTPDKARVKEVKTLIRQELSLYFLQHVLTYLTNICQGQIQAIVDCLKVIQSGLGDWHLALILQFNKNRKGHQLGLSLTDVGN